MQRAFGITVGGCLLARKNHWRKPVDGGATDSEYSSELSDKRSLKIKVVQVPRALARGYLFPRGYEIFWDSRVAL